MRLSLLLIVSLLCVACGPGPKGTQLVELERLLQDPDASKVKEAPGAAGVYREARQYRRLALEAWDDGKEERSEEYALLGWLKYRTAAAMAEQNEAKQRLDKANAKVAELNPELTAINNEQNKLTAEVASLEKQVSLARSNNKSMRVNTQTSKVDKDKLSQFNAKLIEAEKAKKAAEAVDASKHATSEWARANNQLKSVRAEFDSSNQNVSDGMLKDVQLSISLFNQAASTAKAGFKNEAAKSNPGQRRSELSSKLSGKLSGANVSTEASAVRVTFKGSFSSGSSSVSSSLRSKIETIAEHANTYDEFSITVEGYTDKGDATENLGLSQLRAKAVADILTSKGVKASRVEHKGRGQDQRRYSGNDNDRVEVVLSN